MMRFLEIAWRIFVKDVRIEMRSKEIITSTALFALLVVLLSAFAFGLNTADSNAAAAGVFWIGLAFSGLLAIGRTYLREREGNVWRAVLLMPVPPSALFVGKMLGVAFFLLITTALLSPFVTLFFHAPMVANLHRLAPVILLATVGYAAVGTLFGAMTVRTRLRDILLGVVLYPLIAPLLIAAVKATEAILGGNGLAGAGDYLKLLVVIDVLYVLGGLWLFGPLTEE